MTNKIIVAGVDASETAAAAADRAAAVATAFGARLHLVSAYDRLETETMTIGSDTLMLSTETDAEHVAEEAAAVVRSAHPDLEITTAAKEGKPGEALVKVADALGADLIVVGNKRVQGVAGRVLGSIARDVAAHASCDVYVAHTHTRK